MTLLDLNDQLQWFISYRHQTIMKHTFGLAVAEPTGGGGRTYCIASSRIFPCFVHQFAVDISVPMTRSYPSP